MTVLRQHANSAQFAHTLEAFIDHKTVVQCIYISTTARAYKPRAATQLDAIRNAGVGLREHRRINRTSSVTSRSTASSVIWHLLDDVA